MLLAGVGHTPDTARAVVTDIERAIRTHRDAYRTAPYLSIVGDKTGKKVLITAVGGVTVAHRDADDLVAGAARAVP